MNNGTGGLYNKGYPYEIHFTPRSWENLFINTSRFICPNVMKLRQYSHWALGKISDWSGHYDMIKEQSEISRDLGIRCAFWRMPYIAEPPTRLTLDLPLQIRCRVFIIQFHSYPNFKYRCRLWPKPMFYEEMHHIDKNTLEPCVFIKGNSHIHQSSWEKNIALELDLHHEPQC